MTTTTAPSVLTLLRAVLGDFRRCFASLVAFEALFKLLTLLVLAPLLAAVLFHLLRATGRNAVTNTDILGFLLTPLGVLYGFLFGLELLGLTLLEHAGVMAVVALKQNGRWHGLKHALAVFSGRLVRVLGLAALLLCLAVLLLAPFAGLAALTYGTLLGDQDINFYLAERPPRFDTACLIGGLLTLSAAILAAYLYIRWAFSLPILLLEDRHAPGALRAAALRVRGGMFRVGILLLGWQVIGLALEVGGLALFRLVASGLLAWAGPRPAAAAPLIATLLVAHGLLLAALSGIVMVVHCLLLLRLYVERSVAQGVAPAAHWETLDEPAATSGKLLGRLEWGAAGLIVAAGAAYLALTVPFSLAENVQVTAHRGFSRKAPENTLSAIRKAIDVGADWAEIDVQETLDGEVILLHDKDLKRMTGDPRRPGQVTLAELRKLEARGKFGPEFKGERIATLSEVIHLARDRIKMNIELKFPNGKDHRLAKKVADLIRQERFEEQCFVASLDYAGVIAAKKHNPNLRTAAIISAALGNMSELDVEVLSVNAGLIDNKLLRTAKRLGKEVHVWTVNDRRAMHRWIEHGVDNIITDDPEQLLEVRRERAELSDAQRLVLACRYLLE